MKRILQTALLLTLTGSLTAQTLRDSVAATGATSTVTQERMNKGMITNSTSWYYRLMNDYLMPAKRRGEKVFVTIK